MNLTERYHNIRCKICDSETTILGVCDFNKTCEEEKKRMIFPMIGHAIYYHQCIYCKFIFTIDFDTWSIDDFLKNIYNDDYIKVDPDYNGKRAIETLNWFQPLLNDDKSISVLDYGAGTNILSKELRNQGWPAEGWDPMWQIGPSFDKDKKFDVVTAFEVLEHTPTPYETAKELINFVNLESGQVVFSTLINDIIGTQGINYWYIAPRNGHVCMHSTKSLEIMFDQLGMEVISFSPSQHVAGWKD